ncbi:helix-turn-helix transcriptional regulator [Neobacillus sp. MM2021_6]|uniref:helix-turn-helix domain-containing protein n=1 Tax=Bacillaceae TaxID=186817 RepID=UPI00140E0F48|nr:MULTISPECIES: helix-turn-helix transcriptional regulator [Bacillaceae]MBO0958848.1 helix-turn-helix transcriptional regulator [Neobacillus sp. MM2021_6]NHC21325.1 helix-turn-helix transcriptional regulator [Bacillus sp. MM2020_4]
MIGRNIYEIRMKKGFTLSELAERAGISKSYLSNIERNLNQNPSIQVIRKIARVLDVDLKFLIKTGPSDEAERQLLDKEWIDLANEFKQSGIEKSQIKEVKQLIEFLKWQNQNMDIKK